MAPNAAAYDIGVHQRRRAADYFTDVSQRAVNCYQM